MFYTIIEQISSNPRAEQIARQDYMVYTATYLIKGGILMGLVAPILLALIGWTTGMLINRARLLFCMPKTNVLA
jgi:hypothetical protein